MSLVQNRSLKFPETQVRTLARPEWHIFTAMFCYPVLATSKEVIIHDLEGAVKHDSQSTTFASL